jgi:hypothetical protein
MVNPFDDSDEVKKDAEDASSSNHENTVEDKPLPHEQVADSSDTTAFLSEDDDDDDAAVNPEIAHLVTTNTDTDGPSASSTHLDDLDDDDQEDTYRPKISKPVIAAIVLVILIMFGVGIWLTQGSKIQKIFSPSADNNSSITKSDGSSQTKAGVGSSSFKGLNVPEYYQKSYSSLSDDEKSDADKAAMASRPVGSYGALASTAGNPNITDNPDKYLNDDGTINPNYSYLTDANVIPVIQNDLERLVNPVYGDWTSLQNLGWVSSDGKSTNPDAWEHLRDMFSPSIQSTMVDVPSARKVMSIYADWDQNAFNGAYNDKVYNNAAVGVPSNLDCDYQIAGSTDDHIDCTADVKYSALLTGDDGSSKTVTTDKKITLHYIVNYDQRRASNRRILLTSVEQ